MLGYRPTRLYGCTLLCYLPEHLPKRECHECTCISLEGELSWMTADHPFMPEASIAYFISEELARGSQRPLFPHSTSTVEGVQMPASMSIAEASESGSTISAFLPVTKSIFSVLPIVPNPVN